MPALRVSRRIDCPIPGHESAYVVLPAEWLGEHLLRRDDVVELAPQKNSTMTRACIALAIADDWANIPGLPNKHDARTWDLKQTPIPVLLWLVETVFNDFVTAFEVPKAPAAPLPSGSTVTAETSTAGS